MNDDSRPYALDAESEPDRLENQAKLAGIESHLNYIDLDLGATVLDAGCGSGAMTRVLARQAAHGHVIGVDIKDDYVLYASQAASSDGRHNIAFIQGDLFALPFSDNTFDFVWSKYVLLWVDDPIKVLEECKRVTKPGGVVLCCNSDNLLLCNYQQSLL